MDIKNKTAYILILLYMALIAGGSLTAVPLKVPVLRWDKEIHLLMYIPLGFLLSLPRMPSAFFLNFLIPLTFGSLYGAAMEILQGFVPGRSPSLYDGIANVLGVGIGLALCKTWMWLYLKKVKSTAASPTTYK